VFDGANPYMDFNGSGALTERYLTNPNGLSQFYARVSASGVVNWYLTDNLGSVRQIVDASGTVLDTLVYSSFGTIISETNAANGDRFKYAGGANDSLTGMNQFNRRYQRPADGNFASEDPESFGAGDANLYRYVFNQPLRFVDPSGQGIPPNPAWYTNPWTAIGAVAIGLGADLGYEYWKYREIVNEGNDIPARMAAAKQAGEAFEAARQVQIDEYKIAEEIKNMAKGPQNIRNTYLEDLLRKNPKATKEKLCAMMDAAYKAARKAKNYKLAAIIKEAQKAHRCRRTHRD